MSCLSFLQVFIVCKVLPSAISQGQKTNQLFLSVCLYLSFLPCRIQELNSNGTFLSRTPYKISIQSATQFTSSVFLIPDYLCSDNDLSSPGLAITYLSLGSHLNFQAGEKITRALSSMCCRSTEPNQCEGDYNNLYPFGMRCFGGVGEALCYLGMLKHMTLSIL